MIKGLTVFRQPFVLSFLIDHKLGVFAVFPTGDCLPCDEYPFRQLLLRKSFFHSKVTNDILCFHKITAFVRCDHIIALAVGIGKQLSVAADRLEFDQRFSVRIFPIE